MQQKVYKTVAKFGGEEIFYKLKGYIRYFEAKLKNKDEEFWCSFSCKFIADINAGGNNNFVYLECEKWGERERENGWKCQKILVLGEKGKVTSWEEVPKTKIKLTDNFDEKRESLGKNINDLTKKILTDLKQK
jgi:flagellar capping protein FliD